MVESDNNLNKHRTHLLLVLVGAGGLLVAIGSSLSAGFGKSGNAVGKTSSFKRGGRSDLFTGREMGSTTLAGFCVLLVAGDFLGLLLPYTPSFLNTTFSLSEHS